MIILQANKIERSFAGEVLFDNISLQVDERDRIALVGKNGAGKSTLLKILVGEEEPTSGEINKKRDLSLSYLAQDSRFESSNTIYDEMLHVFDDLRKTEKTLRQMELEMGEKTGADLEKLMQDYDRLSEEFRQAGGFTYEADIRAILNGFKFDESMWQMKIEELSGGQNTRLALAKMLLEKPNLLVLDEPTNHLDIETIAWLENYLVNYSGALLIVSHDRYFLDKVATITLDLTKHSLDRYVGNYSSFVEQKEQKLLTEAKNYEKQQKEIAALEDFVNRNLVRASTTKRAQSRRKQLEKMERLDKPEAGSKSAHMTFHSDKTSGNVVLTVEEAAVGYDDQILSEPINLDIRKMNAVAIVGPNGIGKSTLIKSIVGQIPFIKGEARFGANVEVGYYDQTQSKLTPHNSVLDELWNDFKLTPEVEIRNRLGAFLFSGDDVKKTVGMLSGGERARLLLAKLSMENNNFLILDEPTNHLDIETIAWLETYLVNYSGALIIVSHDRYFLDKVATITLDLTKHSLDRYVGNYSSFVVQKEQKLATEAKNYEKQQKEIAALEDFVNRNLVRASTTKRAQSRRKQLEKMERLDKPEAGSRSVTMTFKSDKVSGNVVLTLEDAAIGYGEEVLSEPINLDIRKFNTVAIVGPNGIGKTTLIKSLIGQVPFIRGKEQLGANVEVGYYDQTQSKLTPSNTVLDELWNDFKLTPEVEIRNRLGAFLFSGDDVKKSVGMLSGGERARLLLAKLSMENNNFLILDEPTNHLDIDSKEVLENALIDFDGTLLFVSHDRYFINRVATQIIELSEAGSTLYLGDYDYYLEKKAELEALREETEQVDSDKPAPANDYQLQKENQKEQRRLARRLEQLEAQIEDLDSQISQLQEAMEATNDAAELMESQQQIDQLTAAQEEAMLEWEELAEKV